jgi:hypothetical protein
LQRSASRGPIAQALQILGHDILCDDTAVGSDDWRQPHHVVAAAGADVRDCHSGLDADQTRKLARLTGIVALLLVVPDWADDVGDRAIGLWKRNRTI